jgi:hypothetical protein
MDIELQPKKVVLFLLVFDVGFILALIVAQLSEMYLGRTYGLFLLDIDREQSIARFYSASTLLLCSILCLVIAVHQKRDKKYNYSYWFGLAIIFLGLTMVEYTGIHRYLEVHLQSTLSISRIQLYVGIFAILLTIFLVAYLRFLFSLPKTTMVLFVASGLIFVTGAFGPDFLEAWLGSLITSHNVLHISLHALEDALRMVGIVIFIYALLLYISSEVKCIRFNIVDEKKSTHGEAVQYCRPVNKE